MSVRRDTDDGHPQAASEAAGEHAARSPIRAPALRVRSEGRDFGQDHVGARHITGFATAAVTILSVCAVIAAWTLRFLHDAAFVTFHYARSWSEGNGLTWFGAKVEGYTNFLWVIWLRIAYDLGIDPAFWAHLGGLLALAATIVAVFRTARIMFDSEGTALLAAVLVASNFSVLTLAASASETLLQTALLAWCVLLALECYYEIRCSSLRSLLISLLMTLALLTRMDSVVVVSPAFLIALAGISRASGRARQYFALVAPVTTIVGAWLVWRYGYYGMVVPNTFNAWIDPDLSMVLNGLSYAWTFLREYFLWPFVLLATVVMVIWRIRLAPRLGFIVVLGIAWGLYVVLIGGDYLEFRFIVPAMPLIALVLAFALEAIVSPLPTFRTPAAVILLLVAIAASIVHGETFVDTRGTIESVPEVASGFGIYSHGDWGRIGDRLGADLRGLSASVATQLPGAVAYFSRLKTYDMWGLNNRFVADFGVRAPESWRRPGQRKMTTLEDLRQEEITFLMSWPTIVQPPTIDAPGGRLVVQRWIESSIPFSRTTVDNATVVVMPLDGGWGLLMWYLSPNPEVTARIRERGWIIRSDSFADALR